MRLALRVVLYVCCLTACTRRALEISHQDLEDPNGNLCGLAGWCDENTTRADDLRSRNCMCDEKCDKYGDCCLNSRYFDAARQRRAAASFKCRALRNNQYVYTKVDCPPLWRDADVRRKCEKSAAHSSVDDPLLMTPVTSFESNATYGNVFCAVCNRDSRRLVYWRQRLECGDADDVTADDRYGRDYVEKNLSFDGKLNYWRVRKRAPADADADAADVYYRCDLQLDMEPWAGDRVRHCRPTVKTCPATWGKDEIRQRCESYTLMVHRNSTPALAAPAPYSSGTESFRNVHCAICNSVPVQSVGCSGDTKSNVELRLTSFTVLFDFNGGSAVGGETVNCSGDGRRVYDRFFRRCRNVAAAAAAAEDPSSSSSYKESDGGNEPDRTSRETPLNCSEVIFLYHQQQQQTGNFSASAGEYASNFEPDKYVYANRQQQQQQQQQRDGHQYEATTTTTTTTTLVELCREQYEEEASVDREWRRRPQRQNVNTYRPYYSVLTMLGIGVSVVCLCAHLLVFAAVKELRNLSGKNLASFCVALLLAYCSFALGDALDGRLCAANAVCTYYLFMAAFAWMLAMSFDVWRTLRIATKELRVSSGKQWRKFLVYSLCSWLLPAKMALAAALVDLCPAGGLLADAYRPHFGGGGACWFGRGPALLVFFGVPVLAVLVCNAGFFLGSAYMIYSSHSMTRYSASPATKRDFRLYARLALIMGMTWITGLLAAFADSQLLWVLFILSNASLGLFVFVAFTCRRKVLRALKNLKRDSVLNLPAAFGWSMNAGSGSGSEPDDVKSHRVRSSLSSSSAAAATDSASEKPTSNTYY